MVSFVFQYLSSWVADATPFVQAKPTLYVPAGRYVIPPTSAAHANERTGRPMRSPVVTAVVLLTHVDPRLLYSGWVKAAPDPGGSGPVLAKVNEPGSTLSGTMYD